ncbi:membrane metallo-endopeptidase-like 1 [Prorops nasuta]|uniref:membrane metallo-endopeptidase-like 1 n=1 Tax=Prorops nasuta TaxID=863751 RepID=UPI0034CFE817
MGRFVMFLLLIFFIEVTIGRVEICDTEHCQKMASILLMGINPSVNPCDDFYEHVCGSWNENYPVSNAIPYIDMYTFLQRNLDVRIIDILKSTWAATNSTSLLQARKLYNTCRLASIVNKDGPKSLLAQIEKLGGWLLLSPKPASPPMNVWQYYLKMEYQFLLDNPLFSIDIGQQTPKSNTQIITIKQPELFLPQSNDKENEGYSKMIESYKIYIRDVAFYLKTKSGERNYNTHLKEEIEKLIQFELKLAEIKGGELMILRIQEFQKIYDNNGGNHPNAQINLLEIIQFQFKNIGFNIKSSEMIKVFNMEFFRKLPAILEAADSRTIANYIVWSFIRSKVNFSGRTLISKKNEYEDKINGGRVVGDRSEIVCSRNPNLEKAISLEYVKRYFPDSDKRKVTELMNNIFQVYEDTIRNIPWIDSTSRDRSLEKVQDVAKLIGYPNSYTSDKIDDYYKNLKFGETYLETIINLQKFEYLTKLSKLREIISRTEWIVEPMKMVAHYNILQNSIIVTAALLQPRIFDADGPEVLIYATVGFIIAHEITHAFDINARAWDSKGNLGILCLVETCRIYMDRARCFVEQYGQYIVPQLSKDSHIRKIDGLKTLSENIADSTGLQIAYNVYKERQKQNGGIDVRLVGFENVTSDQLFFIVQANSKCYNVTPRQRLSRLERDTHAPQEFRVRGSVSNHRDFAKVFNCKPDAPMNPSKKCSILV